MNGHRVLIALGSNLVSRTGVPVETLKSAIVELDMRGVLATRTSSFYRTPAWPDPADPPFVNAVLSGSTALTPNALLRQLHETETAFGRTRSVRNAARTLDLDLIDYEGRVDAGPPALPHPRMADRGFVLVPLAEVAPEWRHPVTGQTVEQLIALLPASVRHSVQRIAMTK
jgi:2-amino-4-hydroxy-6-hydroxymethyldihydropteridine diphosphokinase